MATALTWTKRSANRWLLKEANGRIWAIVTPFRGGPKGYAKATVMYAEASANSRKRYGSNYWTTGANVASAKRNVIEWLARHSWDSFTVEAA